MKYKINFKKGIDDLKSLYAFRGNSQGDNSETNSIQEFLDAKGWLSYQFNLPMTEESINRQIEERKIYNEEYILQLKESGEYGKIDSITLETEYNELFDSAIKSEFPLSSYKMIIEDYGK